MIAAKEKRVTWHYDCQTINNGTTNITMTCIPNETYFKVEGQSFKVPKRASFQCKNYMENKSPFGKNQNIKSYGDVWAVPCDGLSECENGLDEQESVCNVHEELTLFSLMGGFTLILIAMLSMLVYKMKRYVI